MIRCDGHYFLREYEGYDEKDRQEYVARVIFIGPEAERRKYSIEMKFASKITKLMWRGTAISFRTSTDELDERDVESLVLAPSAVRSLINTNSTTQSEDANICDWFTITKTKVKD
jgi:hypothetical protein